jgi:type II secretory pathway component PulF
MAIYHYMAYDRKGAAVLGKTEAPDPETLKDLLKKEKLVLVRARAGRNPFSFLRKIDQKTLLFFTEELQLLLESGIDIIRALAMEAAECQNARFRVILEDIRQEILAGKSLGEAFAKYTGLFGSFYVNYVRIGETAGALTENLERIRGQMETERELKQKISEALFYPTVLFCFSLGVVFFLLGFVLPNFAQMFLESGTELPLLTRILLAFGHHVPEIAFFLAGTAVIGVFLRKRLLNNERVRYGRDSAYFRLPVLGPIFRKNMVAKLSKNLSLLLHSGMVVTKSLEHLRENADNLWVSEKLTRMRERIVTGESIGDAMDELPIFPANYCKMIRVGEESGRLTEIFDRIYAMARHDMESRIKRLLTLLEPLLILILGLVIGLVVIAIYLPIFGMSGLVA